MSLGLSFVLFRMGENPCSVSVGWYKIQWAALEVNTTQVSAGDKGKVSLAIASHSGEVLGEPRPPESYTEELLSTLQALGQDSVFPRRLQADMLIILSCLCQKHHRQCPETISGRDEVFGTIGQCGGEFYSSI